MTHIRQIRVLAAFVFIALSLLPKVYADAIQDRLAQLAADLQPGPLKQQLDTCLANPLLTTDFSISHRGAPLSYPEHTREGYIAAHEMGAGSIECDVTFTKDQELVCRHSQCDLHSTTNILETPLAEKCTIPPDTQSSKPFRNVRCCTSDINFEEFKSLKGRADKTNKNAENLENFYIEAQLSPVNSDLAFGELMSHKESIALFTSLGAKMVPELKKPQVAMPFNGFTQQLYAKAIVQDYIDSGVAAGKVRLQSFDLEDVYFWLANFPEFGKNAVWLDGRYSDNGFNHKQEKTWKPGMEELRKSGVSTLAPPLWMLLTLNETGDIIPSSYAKSASKAGLNLIAWTLERSGSLESGGGWYYQTINNAVNNDSDMFRVLDVLAQQVKVSGVFSDWPASTTFYANCLGLH